MKNFILWKVFLQSYSKKHRRTSKNAGFTILEAIASLVMGGIILASALSGFMSLRQLFVNDKTKNDVNQRLRMIFSTIGPDIQQTGEGLIANPNFPAILVEQTTTSGALSSELIVRKGDLVGSLTICAPIAQSSSDPVNVIDQSATATICQVEDSNNDGWPDDVFNWQGKRLDEASNTIRAFIFDPTTGNSEFFTYTGEETLDSVGNTMTPATGTTPERVNLTTTVSSWQNSYSAGSVIYLIKERRFLINNQNRLQLVINQNQTFDLVESIEQMDITVNLQPSVGGTTYACKTIPPVVTSDCNPTFPGPYTWNQIKSVEVTVEAQPSSLGTTTNNSVLSTQDLTLTQEFFPRNRLSF